MVPAVFYTETRKAHKAALQWSVLGLAVTLLLMPWASEQLLLMVAALVGFFIAFNVLEALQPSLVSRVAPSDFKGLALGFYNMAQALGVFIGASLGGVLITYAGTSYVFLVCAVLALLWYGVARGMRPLQDA
jgi:predicted MFS family arabinose efflux permease